MKDNYLWDRSGEPDSEIQELEEILGTLRYQPQPLDIPLHVQPGRRRTFFPAAIAAAILCAILLGLWFTFSRRPAPALEVKHEIDQPKGAAPVQTQPDNITSRTAEVQKPSPDQIARTQTPRSLLAGNAGRARTATRPPRLTPAELAEKGQVLVALRLLSAKLNLAQRRTQGLPQLNSIRNQHKTG